MKSESNSASVYFARTGCEITSKAGRAASARSQRRKRSRPRLVPFAKSSGERQKTLTDVKKIFSTLALTAMLSLASCGWFGSPEAYKSESGRTTFRAANERPSEHGEVTPASQKIPGEDRKSVV